MLPVLIRLDFALATLLLVGAPLGLLAAAWGQPTVREHLLAYWRASSLLMITVYLMIDGRPVAFVTGNAALVLIPLVLRYGDVLFIPKRRFRTRSAVAGWVRHWRTVATVFCLASLLLTLPTLGCVSASKAAACQYWLTPPRELHAALHPSVDPAVLGDAATVGLIIYGLYFTVSAVRAGWAAAGD